MRSLKTSGINLLAVAAASLSLAAAGEAQFQPQSQACQIEVREMPVGTSVRVRTTAVQAGYYSFSLQENVPDSEVLIDASGPFSLGAGNDRILMTFMRHPQMIPGNFLHSRNAPARTHGHLIDYRGELRVFDRRGREICQTRDVGIFNGRGEPFPTAQASPQASAQLPSRAQSPARRPMLRF